MNKFKVFVLLIVCHVALKNILHAAVTAQLQGQQFDKASQNYWIPVDNKLNVHYARDPYISGFESLDNTETLRNCCCLALLPFCLMTGWGGTEHKELVFAEKGKNEVEKDTLIAVLPKNPLHPKTYDHTREVHLNPFFKKKLKFDLNWNAIKQKKWKIKQPLPRGKK